MSTTELIRCLGIIAEHPDAPAGRSLGLGRAPTAAEHTDLFSLQLVPYASVYLSHDGMLGGEPADRVAGVWRALGFVPPSEPDHLTALLGLYASIADAAGAEEDPARRALYGNARVALLWEHLLPWLPAFLDKVGEIGGEPHRRWARILREVLAAEAAAAPSHASAPVHLAAVPSLPDPRVDADGLLTAILAPIRVGFIVTRRDLARCAEETGLGLRVGERRFVLRSLLQQDAAATLTWLGREAARAAELHRASASIFAGSTKHWEDRAEAASALFLGSAQAAKEVVAHGAER